MPIVSVLLVLFSLIFIFAGKNPFLAYAEIFSYSFANPFGLPLTIIVFLFCMTLIPVFWPFQP